jgi:hypothetical protein
MAAQSQSTSSSESYAVNFDNYNQYDAQQSSHNTSAYNPNIEEFQFVQTEASSGKVC